MKDFLFIDQDMDQLRSECSSKRKAVYDRLTVQCESYFSQELPEEHPPSSTTFMGIAMANLSLAWLLSGEQRYLDEAKRWIFAAVNYPHWGNAFLVDVDLSASWILFGMGISYDWIAHTLEAEEREALKAKILLQGKRMYDFKIETEGSGWSTNYWQNHNWINMTGLAAAGYALVKEVPKLQDWIDSARENFKFVYSVMPEDGSDYEGVVYWRYGAMWLFVYAHLVKEREGLDFFASCPFLENTFYYRLYQAAPNLEEQMNFGDTHDRRSGHSTAIYYKTAAEYKNGHAQKLGNLVRDEFLQREAALSQVKPGILPECFFEMLFFDPSVEEEDFETLPLVRYFDDLGLFTHRSSWEKDATLFTIKCSAPGGKTQWEWFWKLKNEKNYNCSGLSHQHPDNNSFLIHSQGEYLAIDDGFNRHVTAADHNAVLVDGKGYVDEGQNNIWKNYTPEMIGTMEKPDIRDGYFHLSGETSKVYPKELMLKALRRHLIGSGIVPDSGRACYVMIDELDSEMDHRYSWLMHSDNHPELEGDCARFKTGGAELALYQYSDSSLEQEMTEHTVRAMMTPQEPEKLTENHMKTLVVSNADAGKTLDLLSVFVPEPGEDLQVKPVRREGIFGAEIVRGSVSEFYVVNKSEDASFMGVALDSKITIIKTISGDIAEVIGVQGV